MTLSEYRSGSSWQGAIELGPRLMKLAEELPGSEEMGLSFQLRQAMVEVPATAAADAMQGAQNTRLLPVLKLLAALDLIEKVYPALDTADVRAAAETLAEHLTTTAMGASATPAAALAAPAELAPTPAPAPSTVPVVPDATVAPILPTSAPDEPAPTAPATAETEANQNDEPEPSLKVRVTPDGEVLPEDH